jgi:hypothetical protein
MTLLPDMFLRGAEDAGGRFLLPTTGLCFQQGPVFHRSLLFRSLSVETFELCFLVGRADVAASVRSRFRTGSMPDQRIFIVIGERRSVITPSRSRLGTGLWPKDHPEPCAMLPPDRGSYRNGSN